MSYEYLPRQQLSKVSTTARSTKRAKTVSHYQEHNRLTKRSSFWKLFAERRKK